MNVPPVSIQMCQGKEVRECDSARVRKWGGGQNSVSSDGMQRTGAANHPQNKSGTPPDAAPRTLIHPDFDSHRTHALTRTFTHFPHSFRGGSDSGVMCSVGGLRSPSAPMTTS